VTILDTILQNKRAEVAESKRHVGREEIEDLARSAAPPRLFKETLQRTPFALIAEIKKASPSKGVLLEHFDHRKLAVEFESGGASALSVLTDKKFFQGDISFLADVKGVTALPVLRKDFIVDEYQIYESRAMGADAILLIVRALSLGEIKTFYALATLLGMAALVETHSEKEIEIANSIGAEIIGINNRDLESFQVNINTSLNLISHVDKGAIAVSESGILNRDDVQALERAGFRAALVGEGIMTGQDRVAAVRELILR